ncbi:MAG TPA: AarF/ABC1/UbiB kinase family protein [Candidatus Limnocylindria bacterium]|nr:AarF/ABC1/UbiB kinase family protein [Candidatus Limnocylindria bacterium]
MSDIKSGRARRGLSVGGLTTAIGGSYLWQFVKWPFQSSEERQETMLATHIRNAQRLVSQSVELRGAFAKLVQMLSMRSDLLPAEAVDVLASVRSSMPPMPADVVRRVIEEELGAPPERCFARFEEQAFAAASLGQVHRAEREDGRRVAVKVQYPGVADTVGQDLKNIRALIRVMAAIGRDVMGRDVDTKLVVAELEARLREELDYRLEAANAERFRMLFADDPEVVIPRVHADRSTGRVLTMDLLDGYPIDQLMAPGVDPAMKEWTAVKIFRLFYRQLLEFGMVQTDPHPGNYLVTHHPKICMLDFGCVRTLEPAIRRGYVRLAHALVRDDAEEMAAAGRDLGFVDKDPTVFVRLMRLSGSPLIKDAPFDPTTHDLVALATEATRIGLAGEPLLAPGHDVFIGRALLGVDGYLKGFGVVRNWHREFLDVLAKLPPEPDVAMPQTG